MCEGCPICALGMPPVMDNDPDMDCPDCHHTACADSYGLSTKRWLAWKTGPTETVADAEEFF